MKNNCLYFWLVLLIVPLTGCDSEESGVSFDPFSDSVYEFSIGTDTLCSSSHSRVGSSASFSSLAHGVSGTVTVIDDCTLEFTNFSYVGGGPVVYFYSGTNGLYTGANARQISALLTGTSFSNDTLRIVLPDNASLDDFDGISVWCVDFDVSFGEARF